MCQDDVDQSVRTGEYHNVDDVFHDDEGSSERTRLLPSATASEAQPSVPALTVGENRSETYRSDWRLEEELVLRVVRPAGAGLGISVAGGVGSTPYRCNDQVRTQHTHTRTHTHAHTHTHGTAENTNQDVIATVSQKLLAHIFAKCCWIFEILSLSD